MSAAAQSAVIHPGHAPAASNQPPGRLRATAEAFEQDQQSRKSMGAYANEDPNLLGKLRDAILRIWYYFVNLLRAICGLPPYPPKDENATHQDEDMELVRKQGQDAEKQAQGAEKQGLRTEKQGQDMAAGREDEMAKDRYHPAPSTPFAAIEFAPSGAAPAGENPGGDGVDGDQARHGMAGDDPQRLFATMTEALAQCVRDCQGSRPLNENEDVAAYLRGLSDRFQVAISEVRTQRALQLHRVMVAADDRYQGEAHQEIDLAQDWITRGDVTPERAHALREIASAQMMDVMAQIARLGIKEQALEAQGGEDAALAKEIGQMLNSSAKTLAQASVFARASGDEPANLVRKVQLQLMQRLQSSGQRADQAGRDRRGQQAQADQDLDEVDGRDDGSGWSNACRPA